MLTSLTSTGSSMLRPAAASTAWTQKMPFEEHDISIKLYTPYQVTKMIGELYTNYFYNLYGLPIVNARFFNSYGPERSPASTGTSSRTSSTGR